MKHQIEVTKARPGHKTGKRLTFGNCTLNGKLLISLKIKGYLVKKGQNYSVRLFKVLLFRGFPGGF